MNNSRNEILARIKRAKTGRTSNELDSPDMSSPIYKEILPSALECFKNELETVSGMCTVSATEEEAYLALQNWLQSSEISAVYCKDQDLSKKLAESNISVENTADKFIQMEASVTACEYLVARTGSVVVSAEGDSGRQPNFYPPVHIVVARKEQLVNYVEDALVAFKEKYTNTSMPSLISFISGPSRTADIEKTLVLGAHGPKVLHVFIY
jgi:L-lactate dehydrogenase complex protein LldG